MKITHLSRLQVAYLLGCGFFVTDVTDEIVKLYVRDYKNVSKSICHICHRLHEGQ